MVQVQDQIDVKDDTASIAFASGTGPSASIWGTITSDQLNRLSDQDKVSIIVYSGAVQDDYDHWTELSSKLEAPGLTPEEKKQIVGRLVTTGMNLCGNFGSLIQVLGDVNGMVYDHYQQIEQVCRQFIASNITPKIGNN